jgi:hypothetical protein
MDSTRGAEFPAWVYKEGLVPCLVARDIMPFNALREKSTISLDIFSISSFVNFCSGDIRVMIGLPKR